MRLIPCLFILLLFACKNSNNCVAYAINSDVDSVQYEFICPVENPYQLDGTFHYFNDDTIIINGEKIGPQDTSYVYPAQDYYGRTGPKIKYQKYKATVVDIKIEWCFY